ncbi:MAG: hypothetical protein JXA60_05980 [Candidatus Coatesbacteria bacterium]|nr:hypothetical protein [Candidatus Coatesbacteria bacterium]
MKMKKCLKCNYLNHPDMEVCAKCSGDIKSLFSYTVVDDEGESIKSGEVINQQETSSKDPGEVISSEKKPNKPDPFTDENIKRRKKIIYTVVIIDVIITLGIAAFLLLRNVSSQSASSSQHHSGNYKYPQLKRYEAGLGKGSHIEKQRNTISTNYSDNLIFMFYLDKPVNKNQKLRFIFRNANTNEIIHTLEYVSNARHTSFWYKYPRGNKEFLPGIYYCDLYLADENILIGSAYIKMIDAEIPEQN